MIRWHIALGHQTARGTPQVVKYKTRFFGRLADLGQPAIERRLALLKPVNGVLPPSFENTKPLRRSPSSSITASVSGTTCPVACCAGRDGPIATVDFAPRHDSHHAQPLGGQSSVWQNSESVSVHRCRSACRVLPTGRGLRVVRTRVRARSAAWSAPCPARSAPRKCRHAWRANAAPFCRYASVRSAGRTAHCPQLRRAVHYVVPTQVVTGFVANPGSHIDVERSLDAATPREFGGRSGRCSRRDIS